MTEPSLHTTPTSDLSGAFGFPAVASLRGLLPSRIDAPGPATEPVPVPDLTDPVPDHAVPSPRSPVAVTTRRRGHAPGSDRRWGVVRMMSREHVELLILAALRAGPADGRAVVTRLRDDSGGRLQAPANTVYRTLHRLARNRLVERRCDGDRPRYGLTDAGHRAARSRLREWEALSRAMDAVVREG